MHEDVWSRERAVELLDDPGRTASQDPERFWRRLGLRPGMVVADVGAGTGFYAFPAAALVGPTGRVYAIDVSPELVELIAERARDRRVETVVTVRSTSTKIPVASGSADLVLLANLLHGVPPATVDEAIRLARSGGRLVNVDWKKETTPGGPPVDHRLSAEEATRVLEGHGLRLTDSFDVGPYHYALVFERSSEPPQSRAG